MKLAEFVYLINSLKGNDFENCPTSNKGKVAISTNKVPLLVDVIKCPWLPDFC